MWLRRRGQDSNLRYGEPYNGFQDHRLKPLGHLSNCKPSLDVAPIMLAYGTAPCQYRGDGRKANASICFSNAASRRVAGDTVCPALRLSQAIINSQSPWSRPPILCRQNASRCNITDGESPCHGFEKRSASSQFCFGKTVLCARFTYSPSLMRRKCLPGGGRADS